jgi:hypothetical protein
MKHINSRVMYVNALADVLLSSKEVNTTYATIMRKFSAAATRMRHGVKQKTIRM